ncbi:MAG: TetR/AcrR family transcriptional regulator [Gemmatimonadota bacterium]|nr:TetR/AcrR family transcriptional regulator [Gemmatimonadota bacterium]
MQGTREEILARASELYLTDGLAGLSMRKLAKEVGVTAPALYRYYEGREALLADLVRQAHHVFLDYLRRGLEASTPVERLASAAQGYFDFALEHPRWYAIMFSGSERLGMDALPDDIEAMGCAIHQFWNDRVNECMRAGVLKEGDPEDVSITMWAHAHGLVQLYQQGRLNTDADGFRSLVKASSERLFAGVVTDEFRSRVEQQKVSLGAEMASGVAAQLGI